MNIPTRYVKQYSTARRPWFQGLRDFNPRFTVQLVGQRRFRSRNPFTLQHRILHSGNVWTAIAYIMTTVMGPGVLSLAWCMAQLGMIAGPVAILLFSFVTYYTSILLAEAGQRNLTYRDIVEANLGARNAKFCAAPQFLNLAGNCVTYIIESALSMKAIQESICFNEKEASAIPYIFIIGVVVIVLSQIPSFNHIWWLSIVSAIMSIIFPTAVVSLGAAKIAEGGGFRGSLTGILIGRVTRKDKIFNALRALGQLAFAPSFSIVLLEIQGTLIKSPQTQCKTMKKAMRASLTIATIFYILGGCVGYAALGDSSPANLLTGFGFYNPYWLRDIANAAVVIHHIGAYQVCSQPIFAVIEKTASEWFPDSTFINRQIPIPIPVRKKTYDLNLFRLVSRCVFVIITTAMSLLMSLFVDGFGALGAVGIWGVTIRFPVEMHIVRCEIPKWSIKWICLQTISVCCLVIALAAAAASFVALISDVKAKFRP